MGEGAPAVRALSCPSCGGTVELRAAGYTMSVGCQYCGSLLDVSNPLVKLVVERHEAAARLEIPLGTRGTLDGIEWEAVGYLRRSEQQIYVWEEYLLFNPYHGYRWLITNGRGWSLGETLTRTPTPRVSSGIILGDKAFTPFFAGGTAQVDYVLGEFYWAVRLGEQVQTDDWVCPGWMLSRERNGHEVSWTLSRLLDRDEIGRAFDVRGPRKPWPPLPHQPSPHRLWAKAGLKMFAAAAVALLLLLLLFTGSTRHFSTEIRIAADSRDQEVAIGPIELRRPWQKVVIDANVPALANGWVDFDFALVDRRTQASWSAYKVAERYSGRDSDGYWAEGDRATAAHIASVPAGIYDLVVEYRGERWTGSTDGFGDWRNGTNPVASIRIDSGSVFGGNVVLALLLLGIPLAVSFYRHVRFEQARQGESDFGVMGLAKLFKGNGD